MNLSSLIIGAACFGWLLPEFVFMLSPHADHFKRVPVVINVLSVFGSVCIAYGVAA